MNVCLAPYPIVFDLDGTLIDSAPDIHACVNVVVDHHGILPLTLDQVRGFIGFLLLTWLVFGTWLWLNSDYAWLDAVRVVAVWRIAGTRWASAPTSRWR